MMKGVSLVLLALVGLTGTIAAQAEIYKWTDKDGVTHYSEIPPSENGAAPVDDPYADGDRPSRPAPAPAGPAKQPAPEKPAEPEAEAGDGEKPADDMPDEVAAWHCNKAREQLEKLETNPGRLLQKNEAGEYERVSEEQRQQMMNEQKKRIERFCR